MGGVGPGELGWRRWAGPLRAGGDGWDGRGRAGWAWPGGVGVAGPAPPRGQRAAAAGGAGGPPGSPGPRLSPSPAGRRGRLRRQRGGGRRGAAAPGRSRPGPLQTAAVSAGPCRRGRLGLTSGLGHGAGGQTEVASPLGAIPRSPRGPLARSGDCPCGAAPRERHQHAGNSRGLLLSSARRGLAALPP